MNLQALISREFISKQIRKVTAADVDRFSTFFVLLLALRLILEFSKLTLEAEFFGPFNRLPLLRILGLDRPQPEWFKTVLTATILFLALSAFRRLRRVLLPVAFICYLYVITIEASLMSPMGTFYKIYHAELSCAYPLFLLAVYEVVGWVRALRRQPLTSAHYAFPILLTHFTLAMVYLGPTVERFLGAGFPGWYDGNTLQTIYLTTWVENGNEWAWWIAIHPGWHLALSWIVLFFESTFWVSFLWPILTPLYVVLGIMFHFIIEETLEVSFINYILLAYLVFLTPFYLNIFRRLLGALKSRLPLRSLRR